MAHETAPGASGPIMQSDTEPKPRRRWIRWMQIGVGVLGLIIFGLIYLGEKTVLPGCDSTRAKDTLSDVFNQNNVAGAKYNEIKTISTTESEVACSAKLAIEGGGTLELDYRFFWKDGDANYEITRWQPPS